MLYFTPSYDYRLETSSTDWVNISLSVNVASSLKSVLKNRESLGPGIFPMLFRACIFLMTKFLKNEIFSGKNAKNWGPDIFPRNSAHYIIPNLKNGQNSKM